MTGEELADFDHIWIAALISLGTLAQLNTTVISLALCPECLVMCYADSEHEMFMCGFCGFGPWQPGDGQSIQLHLSEPPQVPAQVMSDPGDTERTGA